MKKKPLLSSVIPPATGVRRDITPETLRAMAEANLRKMAARLGSDNPFERAIGEDQLTEAAAGLARDAEARIRQEIGSAIGKRKRIEAGERKAKLVEAATRKGTDPLTIVSERQMRRIKSRKKK